MIVRSVSKFGKVDIFVNNAGVQYVNQIESFPDERWDAIIALNLSAVFHTIKASFGAMRSSGFGRIINIASAHGLVASPFKCAYVAAFQRETREFSMDGVPEMIARQDVRMFPFH